MSLCLDAIDPRAALGLHADGAVALLAQAGECGVRGVRQPAAEGDQIPKARALVALEPEPEPPW